MPIFEKGSKRIYFAHIPKSGGVSIYSAFVRSGWTIKNLRESNHPDSAYSLLRTRFGVQNIEQSGHLFGYPHPQQHAPHIIWQGWGPFDASFAIVREPMSRLLSALNFYHRRTGDRRSFEMFAIDLLRTVNKNPWQRYRLLNGHLIPQHWFIGRDTEIFHFEDDWPQMLVRRFCIGEVPRDNHSIGDPRKLPEAWVSKCFKIYKRDYELFYGSLIG